MFFTFFAFIYEFYKQGTVGNIFYIITEGSCKITINTDDWKEKEVNRMHTGDYFGQ